MCVFDAVWGEGQLSGMSNPLSPRQVASQWFQRIWVQHDESAIAELMAPEALGHLEGGKVCRGPDEFRDFFRSLTGVFPDLKIEILDIIEEGEKAVVRWSARGTHAGEGMGVPSNSVQSFSGITWFIVRDGRIVEGGDSWDMGGLLARMAAVV